MLSIAPSRISPAQARQDYELAAVHYRVVMAQFNALDRDGVEQFRAARDRREVALVNLLAAQTS